MSISTASVHEKKMHSSKGRLHGWVRLYTEPARRGAISDIETSTVIRAVEAGLPYSELEELQNKLDIPTDKLAPLLGISKATFHRQKHQGGKLDVEVSGRIVRFAKLVGQAIQALGDLENAKRWLCSPQFGLGGAVPLDYAKTELGAREVENLLGRIEYGVYS